MMNTEIEHSFLNFYLKIGKSDQPCPDIFSFSNRVTNKVESRRDETLLGTLLRTNTATILIKDHFSPKIIMKNEWFEPLQVT